MNYWGIILGILFTTVLCSQESNQNVLSSAGGTFEGASIQLDWTLGELAVNTINNPNLIVTQGFHQPYNNVTDLSDLPPELGLIQVFPNPVRDRLNLHIDLKSNEDVKIVLFDVAGELVIEDEINGDKKYHVKDLGNLVSGTYFLKLSLLESEYVEKIKILKND